MNNRLEQVIRKVFSITEDKIKEDWTSDDISGWDSVGHLNLILEINKEFQIQLEIEEMFEVVSLADIIDILRKKNVL